MHRRLSLAVLVALLALVVAGCGSATKKPAQLTPANSFAYGEATLKPGGGQKEAIDALAKKFPGAGGAGERLTNLIEQGLRQSNSKISFKDDIKPWLGDRVGFFAAQRGPGGVQPAAAALVETHDEDAALKAVEKGSTKGAGVKRTYRGHDYRRYRDNQVAATSDGLLILGNEGGFKAAVDATKDNKTIDDASKYKDAVGAAPGDRLGFVYLDLRRLLDAVPGGSSQLGPFRKLFGQPFVVTANADDSGIDLVAPVAASQAAGLGLVGGQGTQLVGQLPSDSWLANGGPDLGRQLGTFVDAFASSIGGRSLIDTQLRRVAGLDLNGVIGWMGDYAVFVRGTSVRSLGGALVIKTKDPAASKRALTALGRLVKRQAKNVSVGPLGVGGGTGFTVRSRQAPQPFHVFQRGDRVVFAYGDSAARDAVNPSRPLSASPAFTGPAESLGGGYTAATFVAIDPILRLAESSGTAGNPDYQRAKPYLDPLGAIVSGSKKEGDRVVSKTRLTVP